MKIDELLKKKIEPKSLSELYRRNPTFTSWLAVDIYINPYIEEKDLPKYCSFHDIDRRRDRTHVSIRIKDIRKLVKMKEIEYIKLHEIWL